MKKWGVVITIFYALIILVLLVPGVMLLGGGFSGFYDHLQQAYAAWGIWVSAGIFVCGEALLLLLRVDTSNKRMKPRAHILVSTATTAFFLAVLTFAAVFCVLVGFRGDKGIDYIDRLPGGGATFLGACALLWPLWGVIFYRFSRDSTDPITRAVSWLLRGSVLELLIAVPAHVMVRRRNDCSAPAVTSFGIASGIAIMLMSFGPSVLLLYKKRMDTYSARAAVEKS